MQQAERVAIVGIGGIFPGAPDLERFWANVVGGVDSTREVPPGRWALDAADAYDAEVGAADHVYSTRGGFVEDFVFDAEGLDLDPELLARLDPSVHLALHAGRQAWRSARTATLDRSRVGVVLGNIVLPTESASAIADDMLGRTFEEVAGVPSVDTERTDPWNAYVAGLPAGLLARALGLGGGSYTLDAACASSLYALKLACDALLAGQADAMLAGGLSRPDPLYTQMGFSQLRALSATGKPSPFDAQGDGLVVGEGSGIFVLKRLSDALCQGDTIHGVIAAVGLSNDVDGGLLAPSSEGQLRAMGSAYERAGWDPREVDLIECHATGTPVGDAVEFESLRTLWGAAGWKPGQCVIGSVKSNIGHALTAAGAAGVLKLLLAFKHETFPPTANFTTPAATLDYETSPFRVLGESRPWQPRAQGRARRAAISGFGFGGINAHALIEEWVPDDATQRHRSDRPASTPVSPPSRSPRATPMAIVGMAAHFGPFRGLRAFQERVLGGENTEAPVDLRNWWGIPASAWYRNEGLDRFKPQGYAIKELSLRMDQFRIPPRELEEMLPQQSLALLAAAEAIADAGWDDRPRLRAGVFVGIGLDLNTTNFHHRWSLLEKARAWNREEGWGLSEVQVESWLAALRDASGPALSANRTMGALGGLVASRIAREFRLGGPSFTVSGEETSGLRALEVAMRLLENREIDEAIVGAVDFACDVRAVLCAEQLHPFSASGTVRPLGRRADGTIPSDGAGAVILKRLDDAERDGDRIYAVVKGVGAASGSGVSAYLSALDRGYAQAEVDPASVGYLEANGSGRPAEDVLEASALAEFSRPWPESAMCAVGSAKGDVGHAGAASGLASLIKASLCLYQQLLPPLCDDELAPELGRSHSPFFVPRGPQFWLRNRAQGPRRAGVSSLGSDGNCLHAVLEAYEPQAATPYPDRLQPLGARSAVLFVIEADDEEGLHQGLDALETLAVDEPFSTLETLARRWWQTRRTDPSKLLALTLVAHAGNHRPRPAPGKSITDSFFELLAEARQRIRTKDAGPHAKRRTDNRAFLTSGNLATEGELAFVFPGMGNQFAGMGRALSSLWPEILRTQDAENGWLQDQIAPGTFWNTDPPERFTDHRPPIFGQVTLGCLVSDLLVAFGLAPQAVIGYSLGESSGLFALRAWTERDLMLKRLNDSPLFRTELAGPCEAARRAWGIDAGKAVDWVAGIVPYPAETIRRALVGRKKRAYVLIENTPSETVIGGERQAVDQLVRKLGGRFFPLPLVSTIHCEIVRQVEPEYHALHLLATTPPPGLRFYSGASSLSFVPNRESAAATVAAQALNGIDFPAVIERAYDDGVHVFIEVGPGGSCSRMIDLILEGEPHLALSACLPGHDPLMTILDLLARLIAERVPVDLTPLYGGKERDSTEATKSTGRSGRLLTVEVGGQPFRVPKPPTQNRRPPQITSPPAADPPAADPPATATATATAAAEFLPPKAAIEPIVTDHRHPHPVEPSASGPNSGQVPPNVSNFSPLPTSDPLSRQFAATESAKAEAHEVFLKVSSDLSQTLGNQLAFQMALIEALLDDPVVERPSNSLEPHDPSRDHTLISNETPAPPIAVALNRDQCLEFAVGSIGAVLGPEFAAIDAHPTRVRLPDEPLMLVDRILTIEGEPRSLQGGRVVTEHDVLPGAWYLDGGRIPTCIAVESGQADLFLSGYLGIDFITKGLAVYRLLDAVVTFHRPLPVPDDVIHYDIHIDHFFRQGETYLFRFHFEATVAGEPLMSMRDGCAGFFTAEALAAGQGIVAPRLERQTRTGGKPDDWEDFVTIGVESYNDEQVEALRRGDLATAFGPQFEGLPLHHPMRLPGGLMTLVHRVLELDPQGGRFGLGRIRAEADIDPSDWFMTCHFVDDRVMPGTLMFECCLHTLRIHLMRMGWVGEHDEVVCEPVPGVASRLKCRGQVIESTKKVTYEVTIKELGYGPEPYAIVDALMYADGKPIVEITDMSLRMTGLSREALRRTWAGRATQPALIADEPPPLFDQDRILAFAVGKPSEAFGEPYRVFDSERVIARLPGPPFQFLDRITAIRAEPWKLVAGGEIEARYDVPSEAWYFAAERAPHMPFAVLLEAALQPCGWLAAYLGSALTSDEDLKFRNLGGAAIAFEPVTPHTGTLVTNIRITKVSRSAGMIIQNFDLEVLAQGRTIYRGDTYFGFFRAEALANQIGIRDASLYRPAQAELARAQSFDYPREAPFPDDRFRMIDHIDVFIPDGGPHGLGFIEGSQPVDPGTWYFQAHFYQDPVCPGSLGLESFLQLLKVKAAERWGVGPETVFRFESSLPHRWMYRGQVLPTDHRVVVQAVITEVDDQHRRLKADGFLTVDGRTIFQMNDFTLGIS